MTRLTFVKLVRTDYNPKNRSRERIGLYRCICGTEKEIRCRNVEKAVTKSCGCLMLDVVTQIGRINVTHGMTESKEYMAWTNMKSRCSNPKATQYKDYGGRGITVCVEWQQSFEAFLKDMGICPGELTLERIDNNKGYEKTNCCWASRKQQATNQRLG